MTRDAAVLYINGERHEVGGAEAFMMLADYLRYEQGLVGTKIVCAEGDCGACTVLRSFQNGGFEAINSCIVTVAQLDGSHLVTVEGLQKGEELSPVQESMVKCHASQCGYCTPGFVMALTACMQKAREKPDEQQIKNYLTGNLCRCTGYSPIIEAALQLDQASIPSLEKTYLNAKSRKDLKEQGGKSLHIHVEDLQFFAPSTIKEAVRIKKKYQEARILSSSTDLGVQINKGKTEPRVMLSLHLIKELYEIKKNRDRIYCGSRVNLSELRRACEGSLPELARFLNIFASPQIKNVGTLVGNIANASPIGDTLPFLMVADAQVHIAGGRRSRELPLTDFYLGYRKLALKADEIITGVSFRRPAAQEHLRLFKVSQRRDLDISTVNSAFLFRMKKRGDEQVVEEARISYGGVGPVVLRFPKAEEYLQGKSLSQQTLDAASSLIQEQMTPLSDVRGSSAYRRVLVDGLFRRYCEELQGGLSREV